MFMCCNSALCVLTLSKLLIYRIHIHAGNFEDQRRFVRRVVQGSCGETAQFFWRNPERETVKSVVATILYGQGYVVVKVN